MAEGIKDGSTGKVARVDSNLRLHTQAKTTTSSEAANELGDAFNVNSGFITLTDAVDTPIIYFSNGEEKSIHIDSIVIGLGPSTGGVTTEPVKIRVLRNPTLGTTISNANNVDVNSNRNYGSSLTLSNSTAYKGATGETFTNGTDHLLIFGTAGSRSPVAIDEVLGRGDSIGVKIQPTTSNTSMEVYTALVLHLNDPEDTV